jgi:UPF0755 protein
MSRLGISMTEEEGGGGNGLRAERQRARRQRSRRRRSIVALVIVMIVLGGLGAGLFLGGRAFVDNAQDALSGPEDYTGNGTGAVTVEILPGWSQRRIGEALEEAGVVKSAKAYVDRAAKDVRSEQVRPGTYQLRSRMSAAAALALLLDPVSRQVTNVTIPEGLRVEKTLDALAEKTGLDRAQLDLATKDPMLGLPAYAQGKAEGFLFPATYEVDAGDTPASVLTEMVGTFHSTAQEIGLETGAAALGVSPLQVVTLASIVQAEGGRVEDFGMIARVIYNRLASGTPLQMDSTINYLTGKSAPAASGADLQIDSPYNTYKYPGLPPAPICNPGKAALSAALNPPAGNWFFFVTVNPDTGETKFASTAAEHEANVQQFREWQRAKGQ